MPSSQSPSNVSPVSFRRTATFQALLLSIPVIGLMWAAPSIAWRGTPALHIALEFIAALLALVVATGGLVRYVALEQRLALLFGLSFLGTGLADLLHAVQSLQALATASGADPTTWMAGRLTLGFFLLGSLVVHRYAPQARRIRQELLLAIAVTLALTASIIVGFTYIFVAFFSLTDALFDTLSWVLTLIFAFCAWRYWRLFRAQEAIYLDWAAASAMVFSLTLLTNVRIVAFHDFSYVLAHGLKDLGYMIALSGLYKESLALFRAVKDEKKHLQLLYELSQRGIATLNPREVAGRALEQLCGAFHAAQGYVYIVQPGADRLTCLAASGTDAPPQDAAHGPVDLGFGQGLVGWAATTRQAAVVSDVRRDTRWLSVPGLDDAVLSTVCLPLILGDELLGTLNLNSDRRDAFHPDQLPLLAAAAVPIATALKTARDVEALRESEERYRSLVSEIPVGLYRSTPDGRVLHTNPAMVQMLGFPDRETLLATNATEQYVQAEDRQYWRTRIEREGVLHNLETQVRRYDGSVLWVRTTVRAVRDAEGRILYYDGILEDITEQRRLEDQVRQSQKMEAVGKLAGGIAHDFNNLLTVIQGYCHLLLTTLGAESSYRTDLNEIKAAGDQAAALVRQLLAFSRRQILQPRVLDLNEVVTRTEKMLGRLIGEHIALKLNLDPRTGCVKADPGQMEQVLVNLVINARDAMPQGGILTIETAAVDLASAYTLPDKDLPPGPYARLTLCDTGCGMDAETQRRIFEPFFTTKGLGKGTGLGLSTVYGIVAQSGGGIEVRSAVGQGATFTIHLPRLTAADVETPAAKREALGSRRSPSTAS
jgi:PAS domain S-box-containing protein